MGVPLSTLVGWGLLSALGFYFYTRWNKGNKKIVAKPAQTRPKEDDRQGQVKKENKKRQRAEAAAAGIQEAKAKLPQPQAWTTSAAIDSSDDGVDNREFARQLSSAKEGTKFTTKSKEDKKQKSVKQSRAQEKDNAVEAGRLSAPSSTAGIDADDDQSPYTSPIVAAADASGVSDMLEKPAPGPSVLRLTGTEETKAKAKKTKAPEPVETKKQRANRRKAEEAKALREEMEKDRKVKMEAQRRLARESEGRAAKDGSAFMAAQAKPSVWTGNGVNGNAQPQQAFGSDGFIPVQPLDTFEPASVQTDASKSSAPSVEKSESWMSSLPSEEEQIQMLREEEEWSTVKTKPRKNKKKDSGVGDSNDESSAVIKPQVLAPVTNGPAATKPAAAAPANGRPTKSFTQQSSFAALSNDGAGDAEVEEAEWDV